MFERSPAFPLPLVILLALAQLTQPAVSQAQGSNTVNRQLECTLPNGSHAKLTVQLANSEMEQSQAVVLDWLLTTDRSAYADGGYLNLVRTLHLDGKSRCRFLFEIIDRELASSSDLQFAQVLISLVQSIPYRVPPVEMAGRPTLGLLPPVVALGEGYGDCDTKSLLFAALATHRFPVLYLVGPQHAFIGLPLSPSAGQCYVTIEDRSWVLCELTHQWAIGKLPQDSIDDIAANRYEYVILR